MSDVKRYEITWTAYKGCLTKPHKGAAVLTVEIDHSICTDDILQIINNGHGAYGETLDDSNGNITIAALKTLAVSCFCEYFESLISHHTQDLIDQLWERTTSGELKDWPLMDGREGIKILDCSIPWVWYEDMEVEEVS
ncbi:DUF2528 family protein [Salmonella enterica]|nr:DUF2528 family protein [Salmonella enterica]